MLEPASQTALRDEIARQIKEDQAVLTQLRAEVRPLVSQTRRISPRSATSISLVAADGGNNQLRFDPFLVQLVRVVDSSNNEYCLEAVSPTMSVSALSARQFSDPERPTALGRMMQYLGVEELSKLSHMIRPDDSGRPNSPSWVQVYRELVEWAILFAIVREKDFATDTLIVFDGFLRSKVFAKDLFQRYREGIQEGIDRHLKSNRRRVYLVGVAKHSKVLSRYRLSMALEGVMRSPFPCYVEIPRELEEKAYLWSEYARGDDSVTEGGEINKFVGGKMFFVKFGSGPRDPVWPIDIFLSQSTDHATIFGYLLNDAVEGFPVPLYPRSLQKAHENAALVDFDMDILQDMIFSGLRTTLGTEAPALDVFRLQDADPASRRYE
ncbi:conserved hypothetical protein [Nitrobacter winogradskyi Nb-255]|uniref:NurA domain-containing protein n=1 Tax=Nitrobacter winogradskyi (strain ATCC 25391 / DSM 10237 / CIP 104748 / NCIMB 11846 / Nb-255) TaxID=323098 RepID=Q3SR76_NITWN|nr:hypothetical protein [Nitrobacter winogradskyi]ABA05215.1 conserved hypothetical protein [Nitrobacter winogradskyi Nb-255]